MTVILDVGGYHHATSATPRALGWQGPKLSASGYNMGNKSRFGGMSRTSLVTALNSSYEFAPYEAD